jgi:HlyD family secretion protein
VVKNLLLGVTLAAVALLAARFARSPAPASLGFSGVVEQREVDVSAEVAARLLSLPFREGALVNQGDVVAVLDGAELEVETSRIEARVATAQAQLDELLALPRKEDVELQKARVEAAHVAWEGASRELNRVKQLAKAGSAAARALDEAMTAEEAARWKWETAKRELAQTEAGPLPAQIQEARGRIVELQRELELGKLRAARSRVRAPVGGLVVRRHVEEGEVVQARAPLLTLLDRTDTWVELAADAAVAGKLAVGARADVTPEAVPDQHLRGKVVFVADRFSFTPRNVETRDERSRLTFRVKVQLEDPPAWVKPGMFADVRFPEAR